MELRKSSERLWRSFAATRALATGVLLASALLVAGVGCGDTGGAGTPGPTGTGGTTGSAGTGGNTGGGGATAGTSGAETLEARCTATCDRMDTLSFPTPLCEDAKAGTHDAYFCASIFWSPCVKSCMDAVDGSPTAACHASWEPLMTCIASSDGYLTLLFSQPDPFGKCRSAVSNVAQACWGHPLAP